MRVPHAKHADNGKRLNRFPPLPPGVGGRRQMRALRGQILAAAVMASCSAWAVGSGESFMSLAASEGAELVFCGADDLKASAPQGDQYAVTAVRVNKNGWITTWGSDNVDFLVHSNALISNKSDVTRGT